MTEIENLDHWITRTIVPEKLEETNTIVNRHRIEKKFYNKSELSEEEIELLREVLDSFELTIIDLWNCAFDEDDPEKKRAFSMLSKEYFKIYQILPLPDNDIEKMKHVLKLVAFSYLGEKWEDGRRFLMENETILNVNLNPEKNNWDIRLFANIYNAIRFLVRKSSWEDLSKAVNYVNELKNEQSQYEKVYLDAVESSLKIGAAYELLSFYHLARAVELLANYMLQGKPTRDNLLAEMDFHFEKAVQYSQEVGTIEFELLLRVLHAMFKRMVFNSIWSVSMKINTRVSRFIDIVTKSNKPIFELLYPQRSAILEKGLLDPAHRAIVVNLPTSGGKTIIAEFRILQALNQFADEKGWIAYVVPTRALVNQMTSRLRRDLGEAPLSIKVEKMSGALELDAFEEILIESQEVTFDILVTTPEKLNLLLRQSIERKLGRPLALLIVDEAHNLEDKKRGLNLEMLLSTAKGDCEKANFLLLTPFVPNSDQIAKWLNPDSPRAISIELRWEPNDRVLGVFYPVGKRKEWEIFYRPLVTSQDTIVLDDEITLGKNERFLYPVSKLRNTKYLLTAVTASKLIETGNILIIAMGIDDTWKIAKELSEILPEELPDDRIKLVQRFIAAELGPEFPLVKYLSKRLGVHHSGLPEEVRYLIEWLMEEGVLSVLVATTTIAQGINFPVSTILMSSYAYPWMKNMPIRDFWNLAGRAGRMDQSSLGVVGIAVGDKNGRDMLKAVEFVRKKTEDLTSILVELVKGAFDLQEEFSLEKLENQDEWSAFLQYIAHLYNQSEDLDRLVSKLEIMLRRTYGYSLLDAERREFLSKKVKQYISDLDKNKHLATLSDMTGFSPNSIQETIYNIRKLGISQSEWEGSRLFSSSSNLLRNLVGVMLKIPEVRKTLEITIPGVSITHSMLSKLIIQWVSGREIADITREFWGKDDCDAISGCVKAIYSKITNAAPWGLAAIQKMPGSGIDFDNLNEEDVKRLKNIPAMIYYGVNTEEAIVMRMNNVPRSIAQQLGELYKKEVGDIYCSPGNTTEWLEDLDEETWEEMVPKGKDISGENYKEIWKKLSGIV